MSKKKKFLITGATGFVGACILRKLVEQEQDVTLLIRKQSKTWRIDDIIKKAKVVISDLSNPDELEKDLKKLNPSVIYHLAANGAYSYQNNADAIIRTNILGTWNLLKASENIDYELFINTGTSSEYGFKNSPMKETDFLEPASFYAITKSTQTLLASYIAKANKKPIVTLRPFSIYGPYEEPTRLIPTLMKSLMEKNEMKMVNPMVARDMVYVDDVVELYLMVEQLSKFGGEYFNVCTGIQSTIKEIAEKAVKVSGEETKFIWGGMKNRSWDTSIWLGENTKTKKLLKWYPKTTIEDGLRQMWQWYKLNYKLYNR